MEDNFYIIIIDDNLKNNAPLIVRMMILAKKENVRLYRKVDDALKFIMDNLEEKMIVIMDCKFDNGSEQGIQGLKEIREKTSLISVIMMSANQLNQMDNDDLAEMINADNIYFISNDNLHDAEKYVMQIRERWTTKVDCVLEQWVTSQNKSLRDKPYMITSEGVKSLNDLLKDIRNRTPIGLEIESGIIHSAVGLLTNKAKK
jgi:hypothetical protein